MRVIGGAKKAEAAPVAAAPAPASAPVEPTPPPTRPTVTRAAARRAAARRRRVLYVLLAATAVVGGLVYAAVVPLWSVYIPAGLIVAFLVIARLTVKAERARAVTVPSVSATRLDVAVPDLESDLEFDQGFDNEDTISVPRADLDAAMAPVADEGSLWDPLPVTLPTYVGKPAARRTVRTIELTQGRVTSSGHDAGDSAMVRGHEAARSEQAADGAEQKRSAAGA